MAQWFLIILILGHVARWPESIAWCMNSGVGFESMRGKSAYDISGKIVMSPEYFWLRTEMDFVRRLGRMPSSTRVCMRYKASPLASCERLSSQVWPAVYEVAFKASSAIRFSSFMTKGTTCGLTCDTMKWLTLNISASLVIGMSLSTEPSIHRCGEGFHGTASPVLGSLARMVAGV